MKQLFVAIPICGFFLIIIFFFISELKPYEEVDECIYASMSDVNGCQIEMYDAPLQLNLCVGIRSGGCPIIIPETEQECLDLYETYRLAFKTTERIVQLPVSYLDYKERRCDI